MAYSFYQIIWFFIIYAHLGWCLEILYAAIHKRKFVNRGLLNGPFCPIYGWVMVFILIFFEGLKDHLLFLWLACTVTSGVMEFMAGAFMGKIFKKKWWDYSKYKYNISGYVSLPFTVLWGVAAILAMYFLNPLLVWLLSFLPYYIGHIILISIVILVSCDLLVTFGAILNIKHENKHMKEIANKMNQVSGKLSTIISDRIQKRMLKAYPNLKDEKADRIAHVKIEKSKVFAYGNSFHKLVWLFFIGAFLGDIIETIFCRFTMGEWMSRSSVIYGDFSIVWGLAISLLTAVLYRYKDKRDGFLFAFGTILGGVYEYVCSVFTELVFGTVFWDYSGIPFNIGGRINLLYCFFWGFAALVWIKGCYPVLAKYIEKVPMKIGKIISYIMIVFMIFNMAISAMALSRYSERHQGIEAKSGLELFLDEHYPDERMERIYPNAIIIENE